MSDTRDEFTLRPQKTSASILSSDDMKNQPHVYDAMRATDLFQRMVAIWPATVDISNREPAPSEGHWFPKLAEVHHQVGDTIDHTTDHWGNVASYAFYWALTEYAQAMYVKGNRAIHVKDLPLDTFNLKVLKNLKPLDFSEERRRYLGI